MEIDKYIDQITKVYSSIIEYIDNDEPYNIEQFKEFISHIDILKQDIKYDEILEVLQIISKISKNHHRYSDFFQKIEQIILYFSEKIKQTFTNQQIFNIFKNDKKILLFLFQNKILIPDQSILDFFDIKKTSHTKSFTKKKEKVEFDEEEEEEEEFEEEEEEEEEFEMYDVHKKILKKNFFYEIYFYPEIKDFLDEENRKEIEERAKKIDESVFTNFEEKRTKGVNTSYLCEMIQTDSVENFISYVSRTNLSLEAKIEPTIFETNLLLIQNSPTLIEYAAFYGSIQIFQYLRLNKVKLRPNLWIYTIHSENAELICLLEEIKLVRQGKDYEKYIEEAIKCHHNNIANYILENLIINEKDLNKVYNNFKDNMASYCYNYHNYSFNPTNLDEGFTFLYACKYNHVKLVQLYLKYDNTDIKKWLIFKRTLGYDSKYASNILIHFFFNIILRVKFLMVFYLMHFLYYSTAISF